MAWTVILNPVAGRARGERRSRRRRDELASTVERIQRAGTDLEFEVSDSPDDAVKRARIAAEAGRDLVAAGGDGTVGAVAGVAADTQRRLAIVPLGSGNDFARVLGYDLKHPAAALELLGDAGADRTIDLGQANGTWYNCVTCSGFDAEVNRWANSVQRLSGTPLYIVAVLRTLAVYRPRSFAVTIDGERHEHDAWMVSVGNSTTYGGGMRIVPDARLDDGLLDVCVIGATSKLKLVANFPRVFSGGHGRLPETQFFRGATVVVESLDATDPARPAEVWADGERVGPLPATMIAVPAALTVRVPR